MKVEIVKMTPELATEILRGNTYNRNISQATVDSYANDMSCGNWSLTGTGISIGKDGRLLDGQHRLKAVVKSGVDVDMLVCSDIENGAVEFDTGKKRSLADSYRLKLGHSDSMLTTGAGCAFVRSCYVMEKLKVSGFSNMSKCGHRVSFAEVDSFVAENRDNLEMFWAEVPKTSERNIPRGLFRAQIYSFLRSVTNSDKNDFTFTDFVHFCTVLKTGFPIEEYDAPIIGLRDKLISLAGCAGTSANYEVRQRVGYAVKKYLDRSPSRCNKLVEIDKFSLANLI